jgi:hypothetical protein
MSYDGTTYVNYADSDSLAIRVLKNSNNIIYNGTNYLTKTDASSTYATASALTAFQTSVASTYLTIAKASTTYLTIANASSTYLTIANATATYQPKKTLHTITISGSSTENGQFDISDPTEQNKVVALMSDPNIIEISVIASPSCIYTLVKQGSGRIDGENSNPTPFLFNQCSYDSETTSLISTDVNLSSGGFTAYQATLNTSYSPISPDNASVGGMFTSGITSITIVYYA